MTDPAATATTATPRIEYAGQPLHRFGKDTLIRMIADLIAELDAANAEIALTRRALDRARAASGKGFTRGR